MLEGAVRDPGAYARGYKGIYTHTPNQISGYAPGNGVHFRFVPQMVYLTSFVRPH